MVSFAETEEVFSPESCCFDSGAGVTLADRGFFRDKQETKFPFVKWRHQLPSEG